MNWLKTASLMIVLSALVVMAGGLIGGSSGNFLGGLIPALAIALVMNFVAYWFSDKLALKMSGAKPVTEAEEPRLHFMIAEVARMAEMPKPKVYIIQKDEPNAFATGRNPKHAVVAVTTGIRRLLNEEELKGVVAHEMGHIKNRDMLIMTLVAVAAGTIAFLGMMAQWSMMFGGMGGRDRGRGGSSAGVIGLVGLLVLMIVMPLAASLVRMAISRTREYAADETGARILHSPYHLAAALEKLGGATRNRAMPATAANQAMAHMYIVNPLGLQAQHAGESGGQFVSLFSTHPPIEERVRRLRALAF